MFQRFKGALRNHTTLGSAGLDVPWRSLFLNARYTQSNIFSEQKQQYRPVLIKTCWVGLGPLTFTDFKANFMYWNFETKKAMVHIFGPDLAILQIHSPGLHGAPLNLFIGPLVKAVAKCLFSGSWAYQLSVSEVSFQRVLFYTVDLSICPNLLHVSPSPLLCNLDFLVVSQPNMAILTLPDLNMNFGMLFSRTNKYNCDTLRSVRRIKRNKNKNKRLHTLLVLIARIRALSYTECFWHVYLQNIKFKDTRPLLFSIRLKWCSRKCYDESY